MKFILNSLKRPLLLLAAVIAPTLASEAATNVVTGALVGTNWWWNTNVYVMEGAVYVPTNGVLHIQAGTVVKARNRGGSPQGTDIGALFVTRGGKIYAQGTASQPIIFTAEKDTLSVPSNMGLYERGLWGGVAIMGEAPLNSAVNTTGQASTPKYEVFEGLNDDVINGQNVHRFGGTNAEDSSGVFRFVSIRHGGSQLQANRELNALSLGGVGRGTVLEYVEAYATADDGFEFFGGTVNTRYLISAFNDDDSFDVDQGHSGKHQFWFAVQAPDKRNYGLELNNQLNDLANTNGVAFLGSFQVHNLTVVGAGTNSTGSASGDGGRNAAMVLRPSTGLKLWNSVLTEFGASGIELETRNGVNPTNVVSEGYTAIRNTLFWNFRNSEAPNSVTNLTVQGAAAAEYFTNAAFGNQVAGPLLSSIGRTNNGALDPRPAPGSPALTNFTLAPNDGFFTAANYAGAFGPNDSWANGWSTLAAYGVTGSGVPLFGPALTVVRSGADVVVTFPTISGRSYQVQGKGDISTNLTWQATGSALPGTGGARTHTEALGTTNRFIRVLVQ